MDFERITTAAQAVALAAPGVGGGTSKGYKIGAVLFNKKRILAARQNSLKTHPDLLRFTEWPYLHAETGCLYAHGVENCDGASMVVARVLRDGSLAMARPCDVCQKIIAEAGLRQVWYSTDRGHYEPLF